MSTPGRVALILVVDDEAPLRDFLRLLLEELGHRVLEATNGKHALEVARAELPDLVISDIMMPIMGGVELSHRLKGEIHKPPHGASVPVILMSAAGPAAAEGAPADAFVAKPFDLDRIENLVAFWLSGTVPA